MPHAGQFTKGNPGNGRKPKGCQHQRTVFLNALKAQHKTEDEFAEAIIELAQNGNATALSISTDRLWKKAKQTLPTFVLPEGNSKQENAGAIIEAMLAGVIAPDAAVAGMTVLRGGAEIVEVSEILERLKQLESK